MIETIFLLIGIALGLVIKGINITITHKGAEVPTELNKLSVETIPPEMREYAENNRGYINY